MKPYAHTIYSSSYINLSGRAWNYPLKTQETTFMLWYSDFWETIKIIFQNTFTLVSGTLHNPDVWWWYDFTISEFHDLNLSM